MEKKIDIKIQFPYNKNVYYRQAINYLMDQDYEQALEVLGKINKKDQDFSVNFLTAFSLYELERYQESFEVTKEYKNDYFRIGFTSLYYIKILIKSHHFIEAEYLIAQHETLIAPVYDLGFENLLSTLDRERAVVNSELRRKKHDIKNKLLSLNNLSLSEQAKIIENAEILDLTELQEIARVIFLDPYISGQLQRSFLEILILKKDPNEYIFPWMNKQIKIRPYELKIFNDVPLVKNIDNILEDKLYKDPTMFSMIKNEILNDLLLLYPLIERTITDFNYWVDQYINLFNKHTQKDMYANPTKEQIEMKKWFDKLNLLAQRS